MGAGLSAIAQDDPKIGLISGLFGAVLSEMMAESFVPEEVDIVRYAQDHPHMHAQNVQTHFIEKAQQTKHWTNFATAVSALSLGLDPYVAHLSAHNALENNWQKAVFKIFGKIFKNLTKCSKRQIDQFGKNKSIQPEVRTPYAGGYQKSFVTIKEEVYYRVYSGNKTEGRFLTKVPPKSRPYAKGSLALPSDNKARYIQKIIVPPGIKMERSRALAAFGRGGGGEQFKILEGLEKIDFKPGVPFK